MRKLVHQELRVQKAVGEVSRPILKYYSIIFIEGMRNEIQSLHSLRADVIDLFKTALQSDSCLLHPSINQCVIMLSDMIQEYFCIHAGYKLMRLGRSPETYCITVCCTNLV